MAEQQSSANNTRTEAPPPEWLHGKSLTDVQDYAWKPSPTSTGILDADTSNAWDRSGFDIQDIEEIHIPPLLGARDTGADATESFTQRNNSNNHFLSEYYDQMRDVELAVPSLRRSVPQDSRSELEATGTPRLASNVINMNANSNETQDNKFSKTSYGVGNMLAKTKQSNTPSVATISMQIQDQNTDGVTSCIEYQVMKSAISILKVTQSQCLGAAKLANVLHARIGVNFLSYLREFYGGLLALLELEPNIFIVDRIPKDETVSLIVVEGLEAAPTLAIHSMETYMERRALFQSGVRGSKLLSQGSDPARGAGVTATALRDASAAAAPGLEAPSDCLHFSDIPMSFTEADLAQAGTPYNIGAVKIVAHRNRRFGFMTFTSVHDASNAKSALSQLPQWKGLIFFSKKSSVDATNAPPGSVPAHAHAHRAKLWNSNPNLSSSSSSFRGAGSGIFAGQESRAFTDIQSMYALQQRQHRRQQPRDTNEQNIYAKPSHFQYSINSNQDVLASQAGGYVQHAHQYRYVMSSGKEHSTFSQSRNVYSSNAAEGVNIYQQQQEQEQEQEQEMLGGYFAGREHHNIQKPLNSNAQAFPYLLRAADPINDCPVLKILCDATYVPTKLWEKRVEFDWKYCTIIITYLQRYSTQSGANTVKIKNVLKTKLGATCNIKTAPLKALLSAYPGCFILSRNMVHLVQDSTSASWGAVARGTSASSGDRKQMPKGWTADLEEARDTADGLRWLGREGEGLHIAAGAPLDVDHRFGQEKGTRNASPSMTSDRKFGGAFESVLRHKTY